MNSLLFLGLAVVFSIIGCTILWLRNRKPTGVDAGIEEFRRELRALAPDGPPRRQARQRDRRG